MPDPVACSYGDCEAPTSSLVDVLVCDRHALRIFRAVSALLADERKADTARPQFARRRGLVYFLLLGDRVKIGFTTNLDARLTQLPHERVLGTYVGSMLDERRELDRWAPLRCTGEWFAADPELLAYASSHHPIDDGACRG